MGIPFILKVKYSFLFNTKPIFTGGFHDIFHLLMQWRGQEFDNGVIVFDIISIAKTDFVKLATSFTLIGT